jgi:hypothetical protein
VSYIWEFVYPKLMKTCVETCTLRSTVVYRSAGKPGREGCQAEAAKTVPVYKEIGHSVVVKCAPAVNLSGPHVIRLSRDGLRFKSAI